MGKEIRWQWLILSLMIWVLPTQEGVQAQVGRTVKPSSSEIEDFRRQWSQEMGDVRQRWLAELEAARQRWDQEITRVGSEYQRQATIDWGEYRREIDRMWDEFRRTTDKVWADYSEDTTARSIVDFEQGTIDVEVVVPSAAPNATQRAADRVKGKFLETFQWRWQGLEPPVRLPGVRPSRMQARWWLTCSSKPSIGMSTGKIVRSSSGSWGSPTSRPTAASSSSSRASGG